MTDEAVIDGGAPAPAETAVQVNTDQVHVPDPVSGRPAQEPEPQEVEASKEAKEPKKASSIDDALKSAMEKASKKKEEAQAKAEEAKAKEPAKEPVKEPVKGEVEKQDAKPRGEDGKFQKAEGERNTTDYVEPPSRFHDGAKSKWLDAPVEVRGEVDRLTKELERGIQKYKGDAEQYERLREFDEIARQNNRDLKDSLAKITEIERVFAQNPIAGLDMVLREMGAKKADGSPVTLLDVASHVMGQKPEERAMQQNSTIASLQAEIAGLKQQLSGVSQTIQQQQQTATLQQVREFATSHPRFDELADDIGFFLETKRAHTLSEAYDLAERLNPASPSPEPLTPAPAETGAHTPEARPLKPAGQKSIAGTPSSTALPQVKKKGPAPSIDEALQRALRRAS